MPCLTRGSAVSRMKSLPLYAPWLNGVDPVSPIAPVKGCTKCELSKGATNPSGGLVSGYPGGVMIVFGGPTKPEDIDGNPYLATTHRIVINQVEDTIQEMPILTYAVKCPGAAEDEHHTACRPYLAHD